MNVRQGQSYNEQNPENLSHNILEELNTHRNSETHETTPILLNVRQGQSYDEQITENSRSNISITSGHSPLPFLKWFEHVHMFYLLCLCYLIGFVIVDVYFLINMKAAADKLIYYSPVPVWFLCVGGFNFGSYFTSILIIICCKRPMTNNTSWTAVCGRDCVVVLTVTTLPLFFFFHGFWLFIAAVAYPARVAASAVFYTPLLSFFILYIVTFGNTISICCKFRCDLDTFKKDTFKKDTFKKDCKTFLYSLAPVIFIPFWVLFLTSLYFISDFTLRFGDVSEHSWTAILVALAVIASAHALAKQCVTLSNRNTE